MLLQEVLSFLNPQPDQSYADCTLGLGGHARAILERTGPNGNLFGFEHDPRNRQLAAKNLSEFGQRVQIFPQNFSRFAETLLENHIEPVDGVLFDLGISSLHLDDPARGFSFRQEGPLDMRMNPENPVSAQELVNSASEAELGQIFREYGEEPRAGFLAREIVKKRISIPFETTLQLSDFIQSISPKGKRFGGGHPAALVFQALRIAVNSEIETLEKTLPQVLPFLRKGARMVIISFHSLEDRIVKRFLNRYSRQEKFQKYPSSQPSEPPEQNDFPLRILTSKPVFPSQREVEENPRARSARMRVAEKIF